MWLKKITWSKDVNELSVGEEIKLHLQDGYANASITETEKEWDKWTIEKTITNKQLQELEQIVNNLEKGNVPLEEAMAQFKAGIDLSNTLTKDAERC